MMRITETNSYGVPGLLRLDYQSAIDGFEDWALALPAKSETWAVVIHGHGSEADQLFTREDIRRWWLSYYVRLGIGILCPNARGNSWMGPAAADDMHELLEEIRERFGASRFVFISGSMGGTSNLIYGVVHPEDVAGIVALGAATDMATYHAYCRSSGHSLHTEIAEAIEASYGGAPETRCDFYRRRSAVGNAGMLTAPTLVIHGSRDSIIPVSQTRALASAMEDSPTFAYIEVPGGDHDSPLSRIEASDWVFSQLGIPPEP